MEVGTYRAAMYYMLTEADGSVSWHQTYSNDQYIVRPMTDIRNAKILTSADQGAYPQDADLKVELAFDTLPTFSLLRVYNEQMQPVFEQIADQNAYIWEESAYYVHFTWPPAQAGKYYLLGIAYDGQSFHSKAAADWITVVSSAKPRFKSLKVDNDTIQLGETMFFTVETEGGIPQGTCLRIYQNGEEKASYYGGGSHLAHYGFTPAETGIHE